MFKWHNCGNMRALVYLPPQHDLKTSIGCICRMVVFLWCSPRASSAASIVGRHTYMLWYQSLLSFTNGCQLTISCSPEQYAVKNRGVSHRDILWPKMTLRTDTVPKQAVNIVAQVSQTFHKSSQGSAKVHHRSLYSYARARRRGDFVWLWRPSVIATRYSSPVHVCAWGGSSAAHLAAYFFCPCLLEQHCTWPRSGCSG